MTRHIMFDFETLGVGHLALPTRLSAIVFNPEHQNNVDHFRCGAEPIFDVFFNLEELVKLGFRIKNSTVLFWNKLAWNGCLPDYEKDMKSPREVMTQFRSWCGENFVLWARGSDFDKGIVDAICELTELPVNFFPYNCARDIRTLFDVVFGSPNPPEVKHVDLVKHNPVHDCIVQIIQTQWALATIRAWRSANSNWNEAVERNKIDKVDIF